MRQRWRLLVNIMVRAIIIEVAADRIGKNSAANVYTQKIENWVVALYCCNIIT